MIEYPQFDGEFFQTVRLSDVFLLGPFMLWFAISADKMPDWARVTMGLSGVATIVFNGVSFISVEGR